MEDSSLQHISTYRPLERGHEIIIIQRELGGAIRSRQRKQKRTAYSPDA